MTCVPTAALGQLTDADDDSEPVYKFDARPSAS